VTAMNGLENLKLVEVGDFVISLRSFQGGIEVSHARGIISPAYTVLRPRVGFEPRYFKAYFKSPAFISSLTLFVTGIREGQNIDYERLSRASMPLPPPAEQAAIVRFLDWANGRLERAIRAKRKVIAPRRHPRPRPLRPPQTLRHPLARRHPGALGGAAAQVASPIRD
jgi:type I restriction enzyme S subunit